MSRIANVLAEAVTISSTFTHAFTFTTAASSGHTLIGSIVVDAPANNLAVLTLTDSRGNTWTVDTSVTSNFSVNVYIIRARLTTAIQVGDTLNVTASLQRTRWLCSIEDFDDVLTSPLDKTATGNGAATSAMATSATAVIASAPQLVFGAFGHAVGRVVTPGPQFTKGTTIETSSGASDRAVTNEWKWVQSTAAQTATATLSSGSTWGALVATYVSNAPNVAPTANAGADQNIGAGSLVTLSGSGSDTDGTIASYAWTQTAGTAVTLSSNSVASPTFTAPSAGSQQVLTFELVVTDDAGLASTADSVSVTVQSVAAGDPAGWINTAASGVSTVSGTSMILTLTQNVSAGNTLIGGLSLEAAGGVLPTISVADSKANTWVIDNQVLSGVTVSTTIFRARITNAMLVGDTITLTSSNSRNRWAASVENFGGVEIAPVDVSASNAATSASINSGTTATSGGAPRLAFASFGYSMTRTFTALNSYTATPQVATAAGSSDRAVSNAYKYIYTTGTQQATGTLSSSGVYSGAIVVYRTLAPNMSPIADAGIDQTVIPEAVVTLTGAGIDEGTITGYAWSQLSGTGVTLSAANVASPTFTAPVSALAATLVFELTVTDNGGATDTDTVTVNVLPVNYFVAQSGSWNPVVTYLARGGSWV
jgi:hypothetical protein